MQTTHVAYFDKVKHVTVTVLAVAVIVFVPTCSYPVSPCPLLKRSYQPDVTPTTDIDELSTETALFGDIANYGAIKRKDKIKDSFN
jgi:hypothetical protein